MSRLVVTADVSASLSEARAIIPMESQADAIPMQPVFELNTVAASFVMLIL